MNISVVAFASTGAVRW